MSHREFDPDSRRIPPEDFDDYMPAMGTTTPTTPVAVENGKSGEAYDPEAEAEAVHWGLLKLRPTNPEWLMT